jgi:uncharacterized protein YgbK (DUF1537 family)
VCQNLKQAIALEGVQDFLVVSRSDSTLRGHYPIETDVMAAELGPFDAHFLVPAFFEGGRITRDSRHYLMVDGEPHPRPRNRVCQGFRLWLQHQLPARLCGRKDRWRHCGRGCGALYPQRPSRGCLDRLMALTGNVCAVVDGETQADLDRFAQEVLTAAAQGKRFLFRSAASILTALAALPPQPIDADHMRSYVQGQVPGVVVVGSHVQKTTQQPVCR